MADSKKIFVYVSGPISKGDMFVNVRNGILAGEALRKLGVFPFVPHLSALWQMISPVEYEDWLAYDFAWIERVDGILRIPGESAGADREVELAVAMGLPVFHTIDGVVAHFGLGHQRPEGAGRVPCPVCEDVVSFAGCKACGTDRTGALPHRLDP